MTAHQLHPERLQLSAAPRTTQAMPPKREPALGS